MKEKALKVVLVLFGLLFSAAVYPMLVFAWQEPALAMMMSLYFTLGIFLLIAVRNPSAHRSLILFAAWSSVAHAAIMTAQGLHLPGERIHFVGGSAVLVVIAVVLIALAPAKPAQRASVVGA